MALLQSRLGMSAVRVFRDAILPLVRTECIDEFVHAQAVSAFIAADRRGLSLVDLSSFETMRRLGIRSAFTFDRHFRQYGFETVP
jgi:predicted nucleic acid-binding protein